MATVIEVMAKLNGNASSMITAFNSAKNAATDHEKTTKSSSDGVAGSLAGMATKAVAAIGGVALAYQAAQGAMSARANEGKMIATMGLSAADAKIAAGVAGDLYAGAWGESLDEVVKATQVVGQALGNVTDKAHLGGVTRDAIALAKVFEVDVVEGMNAAQVMVKSGLEPSIENAFDTLAKGAQMGLNANGDLLETMNEYGVQFSKVGLDGASAMGLISQGMKAGARDTDYISDALKEFSIRAIDGSKLTTEGFEMMGLSAKDMTATIAGGGPAATEALATVLDKLREMPDPADRAAAATALFGTKAEDLGASLFALDPRTAAGGIRDFAGGMDRLREGAEASVTPLEALGRQFEGTLSKIGESFLPAIDQAAIFGFEVLEHMEKLGPAIMDVGNFIRTDLVPALTSAVGWIDSNKSTIITTAAVITAIMLPVFIRMGVAATISAAAQVTAWAASGAGAVKTAAIYLVTSYQIIGSWIAQGARALGTAALYTIAYGIIAADAIKAAALQVANGARVVAVWVLMGVQAMAQAARMAAAWFIALGPIGWAIAAIIGLVAIVIANWDAIASFTAQAWSNIVSFITAAWEAIVSWVVGAVNNVVTPIVNGFNAMMSFITGIFTAIGSFISGVWTWIFNLLTAIGQAFWAEHGAQLTAAWNFVVAIFTGILNFYISVWTNIFNFVVSAVTNIVTAIATGFTAAYNWVVSILSAVWGFISTTFATIWGYIVQVATAIGSAIAAAWNFALGVTTSVLNAIGGFVRTVFSAVWGFVSSIFNTIAGFIGGVWNQILGVIRSALNAIGGAASAGFNHVWGIVSSVFNRVVGFLGGIWNNIVSGVSSTVGQIGSFFSGVWGSITGALAGAGGWLVSTGQSIVQGLISGVQSLAGTIGQAFLNMVPGWIVGPFKAALGIASPSKLFHQFGKWIIQGLGRGVNAEEKTAVSAMTDAARAVENAGSGISIDAPKIAIPEVPNIAAQLALPTLQQDVVLNFIGSPAEAIAGLAESLRAAGPAGIAAASDTSAYSVSSLTPADRFQQAPAVTVNLTAIMENPWTGEEVEVKVRSIAQEETAGALSGTARAARNSRSGGVGGF